MRLIKLCAMLAWCWVCGVALADEIAPDPSLGESIVFIKNDRVFSVELETTVFRPDGPGPFPVVVINHGKSPGNNHLQSRNRALPATREFLQRGYAVVLPMRQGFSKSGGAVVGDSCNIRSNGEEQADELLPVLAWIEKQPWADTTRMVMMGQSHGGLTTLAYAQQPNPGFKLFVNFAGGLRFTGRCQWELALKSAYASYGAKTQVPSLWFYGENDSYFPPNVIGPAYQAYVDAGGKAQLVAFGPFGNDAHGMFGSYDGLPIWWPRVQEKLAAANLPTAVVYPQYARKAAPPASGFAGIEDVDQLPHLTPSMRDAYKLFLEKPPPRAFALASDGLWGWAYGGDDPIQRALDSCRRKTQAECRLYAVDKQVVWKAEP